MPTRQGLAWGVGESRQECVSCAGPPTPASVPCLSPFPPLSPSPDPWWERRAWASVPEASTPYQPLCLHCLLETSQEWRIKEVIAFHLQVRKLRPRGSRDFPRVTQLGKW